MRYSVFFLLFFFLSGSFSLRALSLSEIDYTSEDSLQVVRWLEEAQKKYIKSERMLFFANKFLGRPYVGATLEKNQEERLVVNLNELDCTTLVENVTALALTAGRGSTSFYDFCEALERIRYTNGIRSGYASRNHYFTEWIQSNQEQGLVWDVFREGPVGKGSVLAPLNIRLDYMTRHADRYPQLQAHPEVCRLILEKEQAVSGQNAWFLPKGKMAQAGKDMQSVQEGDVVAFVTKCSGLDIAHVGILCKTKGEWHFIHASSLRKKVVLEPLSLTAYLQKQQTMTGIRVIRVY